MEYLKKITARITDFFLGQTGRGSNETDSTHFERREKFTAFGIALVIAISLWFIVNLNRDFNVTLQIPIELTNIPDDRIVSSSVPENARVNVTGEGWNLVTLYNNPPKILLNADDDQSINISEQIRNQIGAFNDINILQVNPGNLTVETEERATKKVPVENQVNINLRDQYGLLNEPVVIPDSVTITGAQSVIEEITSWPTQQIHLSNINRSIQRTVPLVPGDAPTQIIPTEIELHADIAEFTETEVRIPVRTRNLPSGRAVTYNPSSIVVRFDVPIDQFSGVQGQRPFAAYVNFEDMEGDNTGRIMPQIEPLDTNLIVRLRSFQPQWVSYFMVIPESD